MSFSPLAKEDEGSPHAYEGTKSYDDTWATGMLDDQKIQIIGITT